MMHEEFEDRVEAAFDRRSAAEARAKLASLAAADPELSARWADLEPALDALSGAGLEPLPDGLHATLTEAARAGGARDRGYGSRGWLSYVTAAIQVRPAYALGGAVAAGIAIGAIGLALILGATGTGIRSVNDLGSATSASLPPAPADAAVTTLERDDAQVELTTRRSGSGIVVHVDARGSDAELSLAWDPAALRLSGVRWESSREPAFEAAAGRARLPVPLSAGSELSLSEIAPGGSAVQVTLSARDGERQETLRQPR